MQAPRLLLLTFVWICVACEMVAPTAGSPAGSSTPAPPPVITSQKAATLAAPSPTRTPTPAATPSATARPTSSPTPFLTRPAPGQAVDIPILMYHHLEPLAAGTSLAIRTWTVAPDEFAKQLDHVRAQGYHTITFAQLIAFFERGQPLPVRPIILTFDDGWMDDYTVAFPALKARGMVGTFFIPTTYADAGGKALVGWAQLAEMSKAGMEIGGHTINHSDLKQVGSAEALRQLQASKARLEEKIGRPVLSLSYPFGAYNSLVLALVRQAGYHAAVGLCCGYELKADELLTLPRIRVSYDDTLQDFIKMLPPEEPATPAVPAN